jgi:UrcA family protein
MFMKTSLILVAAAAMAVPAVAADPAGYAADSVRQVRFDDLNLESNEGRAMLARRLDRAVQSICATDSLPDSFALDEESARCVAETSASLDGAVDAAIRKSRARKLNTAGL